MIFVAACLLFDMFGLQVERIGDVTLDGVDELVVTDPMGERHSPRDPRILIVDPTNWSLVRELSAGGDESRFGSTISVARSNERSYIAIASNRSDRKGRRIRLIQTPGLDEVWCDEDLDANRRLGKSGFNMLCVVEAGEPAVIAIAATKPAELFPSEFALLRRTKLGCAIVGEFRGDVATVGGRSLCPVFTDEGAIEGCLVSSIPGSEGPDKRWVFPGRSQLHWLERGQTRLTAVPGEYENESAAGLVMLPSTRTHGRLACDVVAVRRLEGGGGRLLLVDRGGVSAELEMPNKSEYWGTSMCWMRDVDEDGLQDLAVGCPTKFEGVVLIVGSKTGAVVTTVAPPPDGTADLPASLEYAPNFGTRVCTVPDQDADGYDDLVVAATTHGGSSAYPAALSVVSTRTWKIIRVVFEKDLVRVASPK